MFNKEELELIAETIPYTLHINTEERTKLLKKIDRMIKIYSCESSNHEYTEFHKIRGIKYCINCGYREVELGNSQLYKTNLIDEDILKLRELNHKPSKYNIGDKVWVLYGNKPISLIIQNKHMVGDEWEYKVSTFYYKECELFTYQEDLIESRIRYWASLMVKNNEMV